MSAADPIQYLISDKTSSQAICGMGQFVLFLRCRLHVVLVHLQESPSPGWRDKWTQQQAPTWNSFLEEAFDSLYTCDGTEWKFFTGGALLQVYLCQRDIPQ